MKKIFSSMLLAVILLVGSQVTLVETDIISTGEEEVNISVNIMADPGHGDVG
ncbi:MULTISPECIES: hypothetical protein [Paraliobacillus]|uniref:hypothetical protein n=1 Tax=Paraliobacillus TaxID=200903 RepID=UPI0013002749|nr:MULTISPECIES: hypothetical protein [Paraliobacillus]